MPWHGGANLRVMAGGDDIPGAILYGAADVLRLHCCFFRS